MDLPKICGKVTNNAKICLEGLNDEGDG